MPRLSPEARAMLNAQRATKLQPSPNLNAAERVAWTALIDASPTGHLTERDRALLENFVRLTVAQRSLSTADAEGLKRIESIGRTLGLLSNRLKLGPLAGNKHAHEAATRSEPGSRPPSGLGLRAVK